MRVYTYCWKLTHHDGMEAEIRVCASTFRMARSQVRALLAWASTETSRRLEIASVTRIEPRESPDTPWKPELGLQEVGSPGASQGRRRPRVR